MVNERYPADTVIDKNDFDKEDCQRILDESPGDRYVDMRGAFLKAAERAQAEGKMKQAKIHWLLSDACSMMLSPENKNEPFKPLAILTSGERSAIVDDFSAEALSFFSGIMAEVEDSRLQARLADIVWLKKRGLNNALTAIDAYRRIPLDAETWFRDGSECWFRALTLVVMLRKRAGNRMQEMERHIQQAFDSSRESDLYFALNLADLMHKFSLGKSNAKSIAGKLESLARRVVKPTS